MPLRTPAERTRNNAGKTALLRGISLLSDLLLEPRRPIKDLYRYVRLEKTGFFEMNVRFAAEPSDPTIFQGDDGSGWKQFVNKESPEFVFHFSVWPQGSGVMLESCDIATRDRPIPAWVFNSKDNSVSRAFYDSGFTLQTATRIDALRNLMNMPGGKLAAQGLSSGTLESEPFELLRRVRYVAAHRVVKPTTQLVGTDALDSNAENLAAFLHSFRGDHDAEFQILRDFVLKVFPQFKAINTHSAGGEVGIEMLDSATGNRVPLSNCGTGVEQILSLATAVVSATSGSIVLLDEPHTYLHPIVERQLLQFLSGFAELKIIVSTHSPVIMNAVSADRIFYLSSPTATGSSSGSAAAILSELGHRNSDLLISDRLIFVEGPSDKSILPVLLSKAGTFSQALLASTGFIEMEGGGRLDGKKAQTSILYYEKTITALGRTKIPHIYLFDGDKKAGDKTLIGKVGVNCVFLPRHEVENYLLIPEIILPVLVEAAQDVGVKPPGIAEVKSVLEELLGRENDRTIYPIEPVRNRIEDAKGSEILERLFEAYSLTYSKTKHGPSIASNITEGSSQLADLTRLVQEFFTA